MRPKKPQHLLKHGTANAHHWELKHLGEACPICKKGHAAYMKEWRRVRALQRRYLDSLLTDYRRKEPQPPLTDEEYGLVMKHIKEDLHLWNVSGNRKSPASKDVDDFTTSGTPEEWSP